MAHYADELRLVDARTQYFAANRLGDGGYSARWVTFKVGPVRFHIPNTQARVAAVRFHDLHHLVTGYDTTWVGEAEIAAWEIASGCARHYAAWLLNLAAMTIGLLLDAAKVRRAFMRGRHSRNLYREPFDEVLLLTTVGDLRSSQQTPIGTGTASPNGPGLAYFRLMGFTQSTDAFSRSTDLLRPSMATAGDNSLTT
jgi:hypothetical protein